MVIRGENGMAKYESDVYGDFDELLNALESGILQGSVSATLEDGSDYSAGGVRCAVRVFERYSMTGSNRVSMNVTLIGNENSLFLTAITAGGSQAMFFKFNTFGEEAFLDHVVGIVENFKKSV